MPKYRAGDILIINESSLLGIDRAMIDGPFKEWYKKFGFELKTRDTKIKVLDHIKYKNFSRGYYIEVIEWNGLQDRRHLPCRDIDNFFVFDPKYLHKKLMENISV